MTQISFTELLIKAEQTQNKSDKVLEERACRLTDQLYRAGVLPTRRACQHHKSHRHFSAALILWADNQFEVSMMGCRSTTDLATIGSSHMAAWLDSLIRKGFLESDSSKFKADGKISVTSKLVALVSVVKSKDAA